MRKQIDGLTGKLVRICDECGRDTCDAQDWAEAELIEGEACCDYCGKTTSEERDAREGGIAS